MQFNNQVHAAIYKNVVKPAMSNRRLGVSGTIMNVNYQEQTARVYWKDPDSGKGRELADVPLPVDGEGIYKQAPKMGDGVTMNFKNGLITNPYITAIHKKATPVSYKAQYGSGIPKGIGFL